jgi:hypothetical protein
MMQPTFPNLKSFLPLIQVKARRTRQRDHSRMIPGDVS